MNFGSKLLVLNGQKQRVVEEYAQKAGEISPVQEPRRKQGHQGPPQTLAPLT